MFQETTRPIYDTLPNPPDHPIWVSLSENRLRSKKKDVNLNRVLFDHKSQIIFLLFLEHME